MNILIYIFNILQILINCWKGKLFSFINKQIIIIIIIIIITIIIIIIISIITTNVIIFFVEGRSTTNFNSQY